MQTSSLQTSGQASEHCRLWTRPSGSSHSLCSMHARPMVWIAQRELSCSRSPTLRVCWTPFFHATRMKATSHKRTTRKSNLRRSLNGLYNLQASHLAKQRSTDLQLQEDQTQRMMRLSSRYALSGTLTSSLCLRRGISTSLCIL